MRDLVCAGLLAGALALAGWDASAAKPQAKPKPTAAPPAAASAERFGVKAAFRSEAGKGYTDRQRHMADCLASYPGYNPATDLVTVRPGVTRRCEL